MLETQCNRLQHKVKDQGEDFRLRLIKYVEDIAVSCNLKHLIKQSESSMFKVHGRIWFNADLNRIYHVMSWHVNSAQKITVS